MSNPEQNRSAPAGGEVRTEGLPKVSAQTPNPPKTEERQAKPTGEALSPEEQMALYEKELKENDWGHQPC